MTAAPNGDALPRSIGAPAGRALASVGVVNLTDLPRHTERDIAELHGIGPKAMRILKAALLDSGLAFAPPPDANAGKC